MSLLPQSASGFTDPEYWKKFFASRKTPFEWYGDFNTLQDAIEKYMKVSETILQIGCGSSELATQLYDNGYRNVHSIDVDQNVITKQLQKNKSRSTLTFEKADATNLPLKDESFPVVIDKGTYDALLPPNSTAENQETVRKMFNEVNRVLTCGGRYIIVTLAQDHLIDFWLKYFVPTNQYILRVIKIENRSCGFQMPVFVLVANKMNAKMPRALPIQLQRSGSKKCANVTEQELKEGILAEQEMSQFISLCSSHLEEEVSIQFNGADPDLGPKYRIYVIDNFKTAVCSTYGGFIVPIGRECEWTFVTTKGRYSLREQCELDRIAIILLNLKHEYGTMSEIQDEIGHFLTQLDRRDEDKRTRIDILSVGEENSKVVIATGESMYNGKWSVEEVLLPCGNLSRRLVFLNVLNLIQSEVYMKPMPNNEEERYVDLNNLVCDFHVMMLAGLALHPREPLCVPDIQMRMAVLGLGGGLLTAYLSKNFPKSLTTGIELDPAVVSLAIDHFAFPHTANNIDVKTMNALTFVKDIAERDLEEEKYDAIFVDVADNQDRAMHCPPPAFLTEQALTNMRNSLKKDGMVLINLVTRDNDISYQVKQNVAQYFKYVSVIGAEVDVNEVLICQNTLPARKRTPVDLSNRIRRDITGKKQLKSAILRLNPNNVTSLRG
ncbi:unnamed protein product [Caenorhabditis angaria]|uniref:Methyltransferase domain-containing protein n=1 Tax=Caenorhabditis angaria TaxID=860376 RepID=A0A9P1ISA9_9PELO|nr:unnamed protein product [Caenorhabditis angaria]